VTPMCSMRRALRDPKLLGSAFSGDSWAAWRVLLIAAMGEALTDDERVIFTQLTGRPREPLQRISELVVVAGRRGGKSRALSVLAVYLAMLCEHKLVPGERGVLLIVAQSQRIARVVLNYAEAAIDGNPLLAARVVSRTDSSIELRGGIVLEVRWPTFRGLRGPSYIAAILDEIAFWYLEEQHVNIDVEVVAALRPGLLTTQGPLVIASSPYARRGLLWEHYKRYYGAADSAVLVAHGSTRAFNSTVPQAWIDHELERDRPRNSAELLAEFRTDLEAFLSLDIVEAAVGDYVELAPAANCRFFGFVDPSGGSGGDAFTVAISHRDGDGVVIDAVRERRPPFSPGDVIAEFSNLLKSYRISTVTGDKWAGGFPPEQFAKHGISYEPAAKTKSDLYLDLLSLLNSGRIVLPRNDRLVQQLATLERRTARGGKDSIDHGPGAHDDIANPWPAPRCLLASPATTPRWPGSMARPLTIQGAACARARALSPRPDGRQHLGRQRSPIFRATIQYACHVSARPSFTCDQTQSNRVCHHANDDRDRVANCLTAKSR
jgi:hypothetical protein